VSRLCHPLPLLICVVVVMVVVSGGSPNCYRDCWCQLQRQVAQAVTEPLIKLAFDGTGAEAATACMVVGVECLVGPVPQWVNDRMQRKSVTRKMTAELHTQVVRCIA